MSTTATLPERRLGFGNLRGVPKASSGCCELGAGSAMGRGQYADVGDDLPAETASFAKRCPRDRPTVSIRVFATGPKRARDEGDSMASMLRAHLALLIPAAITLTIGSTSSEVHAEKKKPAGAGRACVIKGETEVDKDLKIYAKASGDDVIAKFTGIETALKVTDFPRDKDGRIWVETGLGREFRIEVGSMATRSRCTRRT